MSLESSKGRGASVIRLVSVDAVSVPIATRAGVVYGFSYTNATDAKFMSFYDLAVADVTEGTTTPYFQISLAVSTITLEITFPEPLRFDTAMTVQFSDAANGTGDPSTDVTAFILYS